MVKKNKTIVVPVRTVYDGGCVFSIPELDVVAKAHEDFYSKHRHDEGEELFDATMALVKWFDQYAEDVFNGKTYTLEHLVGMLFDERELKNDAEKAECFKYQMYAEREYLHELMGMLKVGHMECFNEAYWDTLIYVERIVWGVEFFVWKQPLEKLHFRFGGRSELSVGDIHSSLRELFYIETAQNIRDIYLRDLKPNVVFQIRQLLEKVGKNLIGYTQIVDAHGKLVKKHTQVSWKFIDQKNRTKNNRWKIEFPIDQSVILKVNNWSNQFVHDSVIYSNAMVLLAIRVVNKLLAPPANAIKTVNGNHLQLLNYGEIKIENYNLLKQDFEEYLKEEDARNTPTVNWLPVEQVGAYILSLEPADEGAKKPGCLMKICKMLKFW